MQKEYPKNQDISQFLSIQNINSSLQKINNLNESNASLEKDLEEFFKDKNFNQHQNIFEQLKNDCRVQQQNQQTKKNEDEEEQLKIIQNLQIFEEEQLILNQKLQKNHKCQQCFDKNSQKNFLILNFQEYIGLEFDQKHDIFISINSYNSEYYVAQPNDQDKSLPQQISVSLKKVILTIDPNQLAYLKNIIDVTDIYIRQRIEDFKEFMQIKGFSANFQDEKQQKENIIQDNEIINKRIFQNLELSIPSFSIIMMHNVPYKNQEKILKPVFLLNMQNSVFSKIIYKNNKQTKFTSKDIALFDVSEKSGLLTQTLGNKEDETNEFSFEMISSDSEQFNLLNNYSSYIGLKLKNSKIVFLKRNIMELQVYIRQFLVEAFTNKAQKKILNLQNNTVDL
ncbi:hypothetical protein IMG5_064510 [Ichthyophthirius multifiliis]|uniref:Uncharacterized protein n=1 Tax=Ichthyophthirius multifiliis TaxID=5932 RepID=G0QP66_ICHMU|nr:hypothetical protein IMG5_064510 [Ichthyophthirius multifiliis]EGR32996.1 hypothetical protein IMG5_064510 [Ichthyophthirius multifiliis]|eukprot:XP_004036982.1 hypothetical protein IMG5_064510 [Ichthyophthirius multifiliis]